MLLRRDEDELDDDDDDELAWSLEDYKANGG